MVYLYAHLRGTQMEGQTRRKLTWKKKANNMHKKHLPTGIFKSATAPILEVLLQKHTPDRANY